MESFDVERVATVLFVTRKLQVVIFLVLKVKIRRAEGHRAVDVNGNDRHPLQFFKLIQVIHKGLRAANGEGRNDDGAATLDDAIDNVTEEDKRIAGRMFAIAIRGFAEKYVDLLRNRRCGIVEDRLIVTADIARKNDDCLLAIFGNGEL